MTFGSYIKKLRGTKGISIRELSRLSGVSHPYISQLETDKNNKPTFRVIEQLSKALGVGYVEMLIQAEVITKQDINNYIKGIH